MEILAASIQMQSVLGRPELNLEAADSLVHEAVKNHAKIIVLPELFCCGYGFGTEYNSLAGSADDFVIRHLSARAVQWQVGIAAGVALRHKLEIFNSICLCLPDGSVHQYSKQNLVFWEPFVFRHGNKPKIVQTPWGRIGLAICADMIYRRTWESYRGQIDLAIISSAWPEFSCSQRGRPNWLLGRLGPLCRDIPGIISEDLDVPVIFSNQSGLTRTRVPLMNTWMEDQFAGSSAIIDYRSGTMAQAGLSPAIVLGEIGLRGKQLKAS